MPSTAVEMKSTAGANEVTPLLGNGSSASSGNNGIQTPPTTREQIYLFLEAQTPGGKLYEGFTIFLILINVAAFIGGTLFVEEYNDAPWAQRTGSASMCQDLCDALWFGNYADNTLEFLGIGSTSFLEIVTVLVFSIDYLLRLWTADLEHDSYKGWWGRIRYLPTFFSIVDLASTVPFYVDSFVLRNTDLVASQFLRMFRLFRMMRVEGRYDTALTMFDDVFYEQKGILGTAAFVGVTTWITVAALYYLVERRSLDMIYCGAAPDYCGDGDDIDVSLCEIDYWGLVDCTNAGCPPSEEYPEPCYNLYQSIPMASYFALLNLFGEFPLIDQHSLGGKFVGTLTAIVAVAVFALPVGIVGSGFETIIERQRKEKAKAEEAKSASATAVDDSFDDEYQQKNPYGGDESPLTPGFAADEQTLTGFLYNWFHAQTIYGSDTFDNFVNVLVIGTALTFVIDSLSNVPSVIHVSMDIFELFSVLVFTVEYLLRVYSVKEDPKYQGAGGRLKFATTFLAMVDILSVLPYWLEVFYTGSMVSDSSSTDSTFSNLVKMLRLLRLLRFEKYTHAFRSFDDVIRDNIDVLTVTGFTAMLYWVFFGAILYLTERDNPDPEMASNYNNVPNSMWVTLLNLTGECPLAMYSIWGKIITGVLGLFATGLFGIPIGVLGAGFEEIVEEENEDVTEELEQEEPASGTRRASGRDGFGTSMESVCYEFVNGISSSWAFAFEVFIYVLIMISVTVGIIQTVDGQEDTLSSVEVFSVVVFTIEYLMRFIGAPTDPEFDMGRPGIVSRFYYVISFYSIVDLLAILPFYLAVAFPDSWFDDYDEYLRMFRLLRLAKLDKYVPSITLIDDVFRLKRNALKVAGYAAITLWILFAGAIYVAEHNDTSNDIDNVPDYQCSSECTMADRFQNMLDSIYYVGVHLTGDYPIITYSWPARFLNFFMVIAAVGVVSVPSGLVASGFAEIVQSKANTRKRRRGQSAPAGRAGDDWYEVRLRELQGVDPPPSRFGPTIDHWQVAVNEFLNGKEDDNGNTTWTPISKTSRIFIFTVIILNVVAVLVESIPQIDKRVGNEEGNFFDQFEMFSVVFVFFVEYMLRLFSAPKNREALFSTYTYSTTFFGIVDFLSTAPWFIETALVATGHLDLGSDKSKIFRIFRIFRILQLEDFITAFSMLDNVFRASKDVLKATGLMAIIIWVGCAALFYLFEEDNPNWRSCDSSIPLSSDDPDLPGCYDFASTQACNEFYPDMCSQAAFTNVPNSLYFVAVFLGGEWGVVDFTWPGRFVALFLCVAGIGLYAVPTGTLFDSFGAVLGIGEDDEEDEEEAN